MDTTNSAANQRWAVPMGKLTLTIPERELHIWFSPLVPVLNEKDELCAQAPFGLFALRVARVYGERMASVAGREIPIEVMPGGPIALMMPGYTRRRVVRCLTTAATIDEQAELLIETDFEVGDLSLQVNNFEEVIDEVSKVFGIPRKNFVGRSRSPRFETPRRVAAYLCRSCTNATAEKVGEALRINHTAVLRAATVMPQRIREDMDLRYKVKTICQHLAEKAA